MTLKNSIRLWAFMACIFSVKICTNFHTNDSSPLWTTLYVIALLLSAGSVWALTAWVTDERTRDAEGVPKERSDEGGRER